MRIYCSKNYEQPKDRSGEYLVIFPNGTKRWYLNNQLHREDGPAVEFFNGTKVWHLNGKYHREDGPAIELFDGNKTYCYNDEYFPSIKTNAEWKKNLKLMKFK